VIDALGLRSRRASPADLRMFALMVGLWFADTFWCASIS